MFDVHALHTRRAICDLRESSRFLLLLFSPFFHQIITHSHTLLRPRTQRPPDFLLLLFSLYREKCANLHKGKWESESENEWTWIASGIYRLAYSKIFMLIKRAHTPHAHIPSIHIVCVCVCANVKRMSFCVNDKDLEWWVRFLSFLFCSLSLPLSTLTYPYTDAVCMCVMMRCWFDYCFFGYSILHDFSFWERRKNPENMQTTR